MIPTDWLPLESAMIKKVKFVQNKYDLRGDVHIEYPNGVVYRFKDVQSFKVEKLVHASHPSEVFFNEIRGLYDSERVPSAPRVPSEPRIPSKPVL
jgi:hypothetical protein